MNAKATAAEATLAAGSTEAATGLPTHPARDHERSISRQVLCGRPAGGRRIPGNAGGGGMRYRAVSAFMVVAAVVVVALQVGPLWWWYASPRPLPFPTSSVLLIVRMVALVTGFVLWANGRRRAGEILWGLVLALTLAELFLRTR